MIIDEKIKTKGGLKWKDKKSFKRNLCTFDTASLVYAI